MCRRCSAPGAQRTAALAALTDTKRCQVSLFFQEYELVALLLQGRKTVLCAECPANCRACDPATRTCTYCLDGFDLADGACVAQVRAYVHKCRSLFTVQSLQWRQSLWAVQGIMDTQLKMQYFTS